MNIYFRKIIELLKVTENINVIIQYKDIECIYVYII